MEKAKKILKTIVRRDSVLYKILVKIYSFLSTKKYNLINKQEIRKKNKYYAQRVDEAVNIIEQHCSRDYIVFYNPTWLGVAASTKGLFKFIVPLEQVFGKKNVKKIANTIVDNNIRTVIFSQIVDGWTDIIKELKKIKQNIKIKVIWHGNCYEFFSDYTWGLNKEVMKLYNEGKIDCFGFVRSTMYEFYKKVGFKSCYLQNNVHKENAGKTSHTKNDKIKIGIYNADSRELKNIYTALSAIKLVPNAIADVVPINSGAQQFVKILNLETDSKDCYISNDELMARIQKNDINIYPTFTENAPMFPLESFEMGVPCLLGNNNDYFCGTELGKYVILEKEDDQLYIKEKIMEVMENREKVMELYRIWKKDFNKRCSKYVEEFIKI